MSASTPTKIGHGLAKVLRIDLNSNAPAKEEILRGESTFSVSSADNYVEEEPTSLEWLLEVLPTGAELLQYLVNLFPFTHWIGRYNVQWLIGDLVAGLHALRQCGSVSLRWLTEIVGITIGAVVVPQGMAYALLANLPAQFGLYSSFMGVLIYWFFATSKDITIGVSGRSQHCLG
jgi:sodium-independent sulfate anion transporter 11